MTGSHKASLRTAIEGLQLSGLETLNDGRDLVVHLVDSSGGESRLLFSGVYYLAMSQTGHNDGPHLILDFQLEPLTGPGLEQKVRGYGFKDAGWHEPENMQAYQIHIESGVILDVTCQDFSLDPTPAWVFEGALSGEDLT